LLQLERNGLAFEKPASVVEPYRSGMVGLVYKATIRDGDDSKTVVAKVLRRGIRDKLRVALEEVQALLDVLTLFPTLRALNIANIFNENKDGMLEQLDTLRESNNIDTFYHLNENIDYAVVPKVYREASEGVGDRAIVMDFLEGRKLADLDIAEKKAYSACLAKFDIKCFLFDGYFHGDFHQGNLLFMGDARSPKIGIIDLGVMGVLSRDEQTDMYEFFKALLTRDYEGAAAAILATAAEPRKRVRHVVEQSGHELKLGLGNVLKCVFEEGKGCGMRDINRMNELLVEHGLSLSKTFCKAQLALGLSEGVHRGLETDTQFIDELEAACREMIPLDLI
jgi:predicted unusual protein kinase regulating ubiquinone biosynthesis (AarF/ABC1/UbiB family)